MDIVEFAEKFFGYQLLAFQKEFLSNCYEACKSNNYIIYLLEGLVDIVCCLCNI